MLRMPLQATDTASTRHEQCSFTCSFTCHTLFMHTNMLQHGMTSFPPSCSCAGCLPLSAPCHRQHPLQMQHSMLPACQARDRPGRAPCRAWAAVGRTWQHFDHASQAAEARQHARLVQEVVVVKFVLHHALGHAARLVLLHALLHPLHQADHIPHACTPAFLFFHCGEEAFWTQPWASQWSLTEQGHAMRSILQRCCRAASAAKGRSVSSTLNCSVSLCILCKSGRECRTAPNRQLQTSHSRWKFLSFSFSLPCRRVRHAAAYAPMFGIAGHLAYE